MDHKLVSADMAGKPIRCRATVARKAGEPLVLEEIEVLPPKAWEIRIKILCTSLCHTDLTFWKLQHGSLALFPRIFGHEAAGIVESVGDHVEEVKAGDLVLPVFHRNCGECRDCVSELGTPVPSFRWNSSAECLGTASPGFSTPAATPYTISYPSRASLSTRW